MGWWWIHKPEGTKVIDFLKEEFNNDKIEIIDGSVVKFTTAYLACKIKETGQVFALVCQLGYNRHDYFNFGYKDVDESGGPIYYECPKRILKLLTEPAINDYAREWREKCWSRFSRAGK